MSKQNRTKTKAAAQAAAQESARLTGKSISPEKARTLLVVTLLVCAMPMILGARLWNTLPEMVASGLIGSDGKDDSLPRWVVAFGLPCLMCLLDLLAHFQLRANLKRVTPPSRAVRLVGRWGFPSISVLFCSGMILQSTGGGLSLPFITPCVLGLVLLFLGAHMWDCPRDAKLSLRFSFTEASEPAWNAVHRFASWLWMAVGLLILAGVMLTSTSTLSTAVAIVVALIAPPIYGHFRAAHSL